MKTFFQTHDANYRNELREIVKSQSTFGNENALELSRKYYAELRKFVQMNDFVSEAEEINYFKYIKPKFQSQIIYFQRIIQIQACIPIGSTATKLDYYSSVLQTLTVFFQEHREIIHYYRAQKTNLDINFFIRKNAVLHKPLELELAEIDFRQCTGYDLIISKFIAFEKLEHYVQVQLQNVEALDAHSFSPGIIDLSAPSFEREIAWTDTKTALIETLHIFKVAGVFNHGNVDMKTLVSNFEYFLQIDLGDHYKTLSEIKSRKNSKTKFLDQILENYKNRLDEEDSL